MADRFDGQTVIVTGGSAGIGKATAQAFAREGANILLAARNQEALEKAAAEIMEAGGTATWCQADMAVPESLTRVIDTAQEQFGRIDVLVNNAGIFEEATVLEASLESWNRVLAVDLTAPFLLTQQAAKVMAGQGRGCVVNIASIDGHGVDGPYVSYSVAKAGLLHLTRQCAVELGPLGIRVNSVSPGWTLTPMAAAALTPAELEVMNGAHDRVPLRRMVTVEEVAATVTFLASGAASGVTGTDVVVDGGTIANLYILETLNEPGAGAPS